MDTHGHERVFDPSILECQVTMECVGHSLLTRDSLPSSSPSPSSSSLGPLAALQPFADPPCSTTDDAEIIRRATALSLTRKRLVAIPECIGHLTRLRELWLYGNKLTTLPQSLSRLSNLRELQIQNNNISKIPQCIAELKSLEHLVIMNEKGESKVKMAPIDIITLPCWNDSNRWPGMCTNGEALQQLLLYKDLCGRGLKTIDQFIDSCMLCDVIDISHNMLSSLPEYITILTRLRSINASFNKFRSFPEVLFKMTWLESLDFTENKFYKIPECTTLVPHFPEIKVSVPAPALPWVSSSSSSCSRMKNSKTKLPSLPSDEKHPIASPDLSSAADLQQSIFFKSWPGPEPSPKSIPSLTETDILREFDDVSDGKNLSPNTPSAIMENNISQQSQTGIFSHAKIPHYTDDEILKKISKDVTLPILLLSTPKEPSAHEVDYCCGGVLCLMCMNKLSDPCLLLCGHVFCTGCVNDAIRDSIYPLPLACPLCRKPVITSTVSEEMTKAAKQHHDAALVFKSIKKQDSSSHQPCKTTDCPTIVNASCKYCGALCAIHDDRQEGTTAPDSLLLKADKLSQDVQKCICTKHKQIIKFYCDKCPESPLKCSECFVEDKKARTEKHNISDITHDFPNLDQLLDNAKIKIEKKKRVIRESLEKLHHDKMEFQNNFEENLQSLNSYLQELKRAFKKFKNALKTQFETLSKAIEDEINFKEQDLKLEERRLILAEKVLQVESALDKPRCFSRVSNILAHCGRVTATMTEYLSVDSKKINFKRPDIVLQELEKSNQRLFFHLDVKHTLQQAPVSEANNLFIWDVASDPRKKRAYAIDGERGQLYRFTKNQTTFSKIDANLLYPGGLHCIRSVSVSQNSILAVSDTLARRVNLYDSDDMTPCRVIRMVDVDDSDKPGLPCSISFDSRGHLFIADAAHNCIHELSSDFYPLRKIRLNSVTTVSKACPLSICHDERNRLYILLRQSKYVLVSKNETDFDQIAVERQTQSNHCSIRCARQGKFSIWDYETRTARFYDHTGKVESVLGID